MCYLSRQTRTAMLDSINQEYIKTARAKGLKNSKIIFKHALRNALIPVITYLGPQVAFTLCGGFVVESVFSIRDWDVISYSPFRTVIIRLLWELPFPGSIYYSDEPGCRPPL